MKKLTLLIGILSLFLIGHIVFSKTSTDNIPAMKTMRGPILINRLTEENFKINLFYSDLTLSQIEAYEVTTSEVKPLDTTYTSFTEGFIEDEKNALLLETVNLYRTLEGLEPITYYHNYIELGNYGFLCLTEGLSTLYRINLSTYEVTCPSFDSVYALQNQYIYHISEDDNAYYVLSAEANSYSAYWYKLDKIDFHLLASRQLTPPSKATLSSHYALDSNGNAYFIGNNSLFVITPEETINLPLSFDPESIYYADNQLYILATSELFLSYSIYNSDIGLVQSGQVNLPNKFVSLISYTIQNSILYTVTYDESHPLYRNYITLYNLENNNIIYCQALRTSQNDQLSLLGTNYD